MKKLYISILFISFSLFACSDLPSDEVVVKSAQQALQAKGDAFVTDTATSRIKFTGRGVGKSHAGWFKLYSGTISIANNEITGGSFVINIKSMDLEEKRRCL